MSEIILIRLPGFSHDGLSNVWRDMADMMQKVQDLRSDPKAWGDSLEKDAKADVEKVGYWRLHPTVGVQLHDAREIRIMPKGKGFIAMLGELYWQHQSTDKQGKIVATYATLREAIDTLYNLKGK